MSNSLQSSILALLMTLVSPIASAQPEWRTVSNPQSPQTGAAIAFDEARGQLISFGGTSAFPDDSSYISSGETRIWDGSAWQVQNVPGPSARYGAAMVFNEALGKIVLVGGSKNYRNGADRYNDTWTWDGNAWTLEDTNAPSPVRDHALGYDPVSQQVVLYGGSLTDNTWSKDTWTWDGQTWTNHPNSGLAILDTHSMTFDENLGQVVIVGGENPGPIGTDNKRVWAWDGQAWQFASPFLDLGFFSGSASAFDPTLDCLIVMVTQSNSDSSNPVSSMFTWDGTALTELAGASLGPIGPSHLVNDTQNNRLLLLAESTQDPSENGTLWAWDTTAWVPLEPTMPKLSFRAALATDTARGEVLAVGDNAYRQSLSTLQRNLETWVWDGQGWTYRTSQGPSYRSGHSMTFDEARGEIILTAGYDADGGFESFGGYPLRDAWAWDGQQWRALPSMPDLRAEHATVYDKARQETVLFGGATSWEPFATFDLRGWTGETWTFDGTQWAVKSTTGPAPRANHAMAYDEMNGEIVLFGGRGDDSTGILGDTWTWDGTTWTQHEVSGPSARRDHAMIYDPALERVLLFGGTPSLYTDMNTAALNDVWAWDGQAWAPLDVRVPFSKRFSHSTAIDPTTGRPLLFGGTGDNVTKIDTQILLSLCSIADRNADGVVDNGDISVFISDFLGRTPGSDINGDGILDYGDIQAFIIAFLAGCV
ncbi:MAG: hypothetical protein ACI89L_001325 [Phycisphaerales bacterium]|jgi:hypothetical protein